jgi:8-oxo-dGTP pyrophosphatase MutT (NUDIX family)
MSLKRQLASWLRRFPPLRWLLALVVRLSVPRHYVGAAGVIFNEAGQALLMEHVFRPYYPWGLPGGWVERGESPAEAVRREVEEELGLRIEVKELLLCDLQGGDWQNTTPRGLGLVFYCSLAGEDQLSPGSLAHAQKGPEILSIEWVDPTAIQYRLAPLEHRGILLAKQVFDREQGNKKEEIRD